MGSRSPDVGVPGEGALFTSIRRILENTHLGESLTQILCPLPRKQVNGRNLTDIINEEHENVRYAPFHVLREELSLPTGA